MSGAHSASEHAAPVHRHGEVARLVISIIVLLVAAITAWELAPHRGADPFLVRVPARGLSLLAVVGLGAIINLFVYVIASLGSPAGDRRRFGRFWP
ncbi:MAG: hypothetical protein JO347_04940 [Candidatus Eremiobacteraeota bacterium]|nr:hypothetical protein [Candidatus Eremiobacteraeota bacterium]